MNLPIVSSAFGLFIDHHQGLFVCIKSVSFNRWDITTEVCEIVYEFKVFGTVLFKIQEFYFILVPLGANASGYLFQIMQQTFCLGWCICEKC